MPQPTNVRSYAKINLGLRIGPPLPDGYHRLTTLFQTLAVHDVVQVAAERAARTEITLEASVASVPTDARNTAFRMVELALAEMNVTARVHVALQKNLPAQGGLGAGSANAAAALIGLERQLGMEMPSAERLRVAARVGADVPVFLVGGTVYAHDRGQIVLPYPDVPSLACLLVSPGFGVSTPVAFREWDARVGELAPGIAEERRMI